MMSNQITETRPRTDGEREQDLPYVAQLYVRGIPMGEIAEAIEKRHGIGVRCYAYAISEDIVRIRQEWINSSLIEFNERRAIELAHLDQLENEYWKAWKDSCTTKTVSENISQTEQVIVAGQIHNLETTSSKEIISPTDGNPLYLQGVERCIDKRCKILGLLSPQVFQVDWRRDVEKLGWKPEELKESAVKTILEMLQSAADDQRLASGNIVDGEYSDSDDKE
jgi:hypothetical protein